MIIIKYALAIFLLSFSTVLATNGNPVTSRTPIQNQNQMEVENQGEDQPMLFQTQEMENTESGFAQRLMDESAQINQERIQSQEQVQTQIQIIEKRSKFLNFLIGPNYKAIKSLENELEQNQSRLDQLIQLKSQNSDPAQDLALTQAIQFMTEQNTVLQEKITVQNQTKSLLGWLFRLFAK